MLVLARRKGEKVVLTVPPSNVEQRIVVTLTEIRTFNIAGLAFAADESIKINRGEVQERIDHERRTS